MQQVKPTIHGEDHCPWGPDPIPCFPSLDEFVVTIPWARAYQKGSEVGGTDQVLTTATITRVSTNAQLNDYPAFFDVVTGASTAIEIFVRGYYIIRMAAALTTMVNGEKLKFHIGGAGGKVPGHYAEFRSHGGVDEVGFAWPLQLAIGAIIEPWVYHATGTNESIGSRMLEICCLGTFTGPAAGDDGTFFA